MEMLVCAPLFFFLLQKAEGAQRLWERLFAAAECCIGEQKAFSVLILPYLPTPAIAHFFPLSSDEKFLCASFAPPALHLRMS